MKTTVQEKVEVARVVVAPVEKHARGNDEALARGTIAEEPVTRSVEPEP